MPPLDIFSFHMSSHQEGNDQPPQPRVLPQATGLDQDVSDLELGSAIIADSSSSELSEDDEVDEPEATRPRRQAPTPKKVQADLDTEDEIIVEMKSQGSKEKDIRARLIIEGHTDYSIKTISSRWLRLRRIIEARSEKLLDDELTDWHEGEDELLEQAYATARAQVDEEKSTIDDKLWKYTSQQLRMKMGRAKYSAAACKQRYEAIQAGSARIPPELDPNPASRAEERAAKLAARAAEKEEAERKAKAILDARIASGAELLALRKRQGRERKKKEKLLLQTRNAKNVASRSLKEKAADHARVLREKRLLDREAAKELAAARDKVKLARQAATQPSDSTPEASSGACAIAPPPSTTSFPEGTAADTGGSEDAPLFVTDEEHPVAPAAPHEPLDTFDVPQEQFLPAEQDYHEMAWNKYQPEQQQQAMMEWTYQALDDPWTPVEPMNPYGQFNPGVVPTYDHWQGGMVPYQVAAATEAYVPQSFLSEAAMPYDNGFISTTPNEGSTNLFVQHPEAEWSSMPGFQDFGAATLRDFPDPIYRAPDQSRLLTPPIVPSQPAAGMTGTTTRGRASTSGVRKRRSKAAK